MAGFSTRTRRLRRCQNGSAVTVIIGIIAVLGALTAYLATSVSQSNSSRELFQVRTELESQMQLIRSDLMNCVLIYDSGQNENTAGNRAYPHSPINDSSPINGATYDNTLQYVECPGKTGQTPPEKQFIWHPSNGKFLPPLIPGFTSSWSYENDDDGVTAGTGVRFIITGSTNPGVLGAMRAIRDGFSAGEVDVDEATGTLTFWIIRN